MRWPAAAPPPQVAARRARTRRAEALFAAAVAVAALALFAATQAAAGGGRGGAHAVAAIARNGAVVETIDLAAVDEPYTLRFESADGTNVVSVEPGRIRVSEADCPDKVCVDTGWIDSPGRPIACVPHGLTIVVECAGGDTDALDAVAG